MTKKELMALNAELIALLESMRDQIDDTIDELAAVEDEDADELLDADDDETGGE